MKITIMSWSGIGAILLTSSAWSLFLSDYCQAGTIDSVPTLSLSVEGFAGPKWEYSPAVDVLQDLPGGGKKLGVPKALEHILGNNAAIEIKEIEFDPDPFVLNNVLITNPTGATQVYTFGIGLPTVFGAPNLIAGLIDLDVIDGGTNGASVSSVLGFPIYSAQIDFVQVESLFDAPFSLTVPAGPIGGSNNAVASFGPQFNNVAVANNIGIQLRFQLSPGDTATIISRFDVIPVPEPATLWLFGATLFAAFAVRLRH